MRRGRLLALLAASLALGLALVVGVSVWQQQVPPRLLRVLMSVPATRHLAEYWVQATAPPAAPGVTVLGRGDRVPPLVLRDMDGKPQPLGQWQGKRVLLNFWATWCLPCRREMPALSAAQRRHAGDDVQIIGIAMDDPDAVRAFLAQAPVDYPVLIGLGADRDPAVLFGDTRGLLPFSVLIDADGRVAGTRLGTLDRARIDTWLH